MVEIIMAVAGSGAVVGIVGWIIQLGNRVSVVEAQRDGLVDLINSQFKDVGRRLDRIERGMNGHLKDHEDD